MTTITNKHPRGPVSVVITPEMGMTLRPGAWNAYFFDWPALDDEEREALLDEHFSNEDAGRVLAGQLQPFGVFGDTRQSGEPETLLNVLDCQIDGVLLFDPRTGQIHHSDEGVTRAREAKLDDLQVTRREPTGGDEDDDA
jgi:hypothetical protein